MLADFGVRERRTGARFRTRRNQEFLYDETFLAYLVISVLFVARLFNTKYRELLTYTEVIIT